ncbi:hypothetical protein FNV43_RR02630 [Rhamnella rubrinervis]|uniref:Uncharacterized protein n=1 Tax=Rhamnella rubrinervis TaxID=2594499 RepID=A0A8K0HT96_9ROSA|nr:hypothetical protein FNV43_RR02630 [Rhamnella rubrinervis]
MGNGFGVKRLRREVLEDPAAFGWRLEEDTLGLAFSFCADSPMFSKAASAASVVRFCVCVIIQGQVVNVEADRRQNVFAKKQLKPYRLERMGAFEAVKLLRSKWDDSRGMWELSPPVEIHRRGLVCYLTEDLRNQGFILALYAGEASFS